MDHSPGVKRDTIAHLPPGAFVTEAANVVLLGPAGRGKTRLAIGLGMKAAHGGRHALFAIATPSVALLEGAHH